MIFFENVSYQYPRGPLAIRDVTLEIRKGEFVGVIGHSGAGKTTMAKLAVGLLKPTRGRVLVDGADTAKTPVSELARKVGYVYQNPDMMLFASSILEEVSFALRNLGYPEGEIEERVLKALRAVDLNKPLTASPHALSFGEKHRLAIACVLAVEPDYIILDEPTTGLDYHRCLLLFEVLKKLHQAGRTVIVITHDLDLLARFSTRVIVLERGTVVRDGTPREVLGDIEFLSEHSFIPTHLLMLAKKTRSDELTPEGIARAVAAHLRGLPELDSPAQSQTAGPTP
uniref:ABC transporter ATP-binding protein n=1 Tax=Thermofilum pendens TaxID=2269 RepID=A0A7C4FBQ0_THEPE